MKHLFTVLMLTLWIGMPFFAHAQANRQVYMPEQATLGETGPDGLTKLHISDKLNSTPEAKAALAEFHRLKAAGLLPAPHKSTAVVGQTDFFSVLNITSGQFEDLEFQLMATDPAVPPRFQIWVEIAELDNGTVNQDVLDEVVAAMANRTPPGSINASAGIIENDEIIFGVPPDVDGDDISDVLLFDVRDDFDAQNNPVFIAGFVTQSDLVQNGGSGNFRDILYLDTNPTLTIRGVDEVSQTAVHEYQHLIHFNWDREEIPFINEGLSEWGEVALGYQGRGIEYLVDPARYNVPLLRFRQTDSFDDRQRGTLFINYISDRFGPLEAGKITRATAEGSTGLRDALINMQASATLEELIFDFHVANFFSDTSLDPRYGYTTQQRQGIRAAASARFDGRVDAETPDKRVGIWNGGVQYLLWEQVIDFSVMLTPIDGAADLRAEAFLFGEDGSYQGSQPLSFSGDETLFDGTYSRIVVIVVNENPDGLLKSINYSATWTQPEVMVTLETTQYDSGQATSGLFFTLSTGVDGALATQFPNPDPDHVTTLDRVFLAPYFINQFVDGNGNPLGSPNDPRDFTLYVWGPGGNGAPGDILFQREMNDPRAYAAVTSLTINFFELDLTPFSQEIGPLPDTVYVGYGEAGTDENNHVAGVSSYTGGNVSFLGRLSDGGWTPLNGVELSSGTTINDSVIPIRARFAISPIPTAIDDAAEVPEQIVLHQNYPNPFNPATSISYALPQATHVRLAVYDLLGREVAVLVDGMEASGHYLMQLNASAWASGVYFYTLETATQVQTQRMVLLK